MGARIIPDRRRRLRVRRPPRARRARPCRDVHPPSLLRNARREPPARALYCPRLPRPKRWKGRRRRGVRGRRCVVLARAGAAPREETSSQYAHGYCVFNYDHHHFNFNNRRRHHAKQKHARRLARPWDQAPLAVASKGAGRGVGEYAARAEAAAACSQPRAAWIRPFCGRTGGASGGVWQVAWAAVV